MGGEMLERALQAVEVRSAADQVLAQILGLIQRGVMKVGDRLPSEAELARLLNVGRSTVREAKRELVARGFLEPRGKRGTFVATPSPDSLNLDMLALFFSDEAMRDLHEARQILEVGTARLCAQRATPEDIAALEEILASLEMKKGNAAEFWPLTVGFHRRLVHAAHNTIVAQLFEVLSRLILERQMLVYRSVTGKDLVIEEHRELLRVVMRHDPAAAGAAMTKHLAESDARREKAKRNWTDNAGDTV
jgi:GntR family transcriptional repressor for pyruvate dehydrogenase complex